MIKFGGDFTKIIIKGYLKNITEDKINKFSCKAIKNKNKISYIIDKDKYTIEHFNQKKITLTRETSDYISKMVFINNKKTIIDYLIKDNNIFLEINMKTKNISISDKYIKINYIITDSSNEYEYYLEMSD